MTVMLAGRLWAVFCHGIGGLVTDDGDHTGFVMSAGVTIAALYAVVYTTRLVYHIPLGPTVSKLFDCGNVGSFATTYAMVGFFTAIFTGGNNIKCSLAGEIVTELFSGD